MKIAIVTVDGETISQHFGRSPYYRIFKIDGDAIIDEGLRERGTGHFARGNKPHEHTEHHNSNGKHGYGADADAKHLSMAQEIADCDVLIAGGMGQGAYDNFVRAGLKVYLTDQTQIIDAVSLLIKGQLKNLAQSRTD